MQFPGKFRERANFEISIFLSLLELLSLKFRATLVYIPSDGALAGLDDVFHACLAFDWVVSVEIGAIGVCEVLVGLVVRHIVAAVLVGSARSCASSSCPPAPSHPPGHRWSHQAAVVVQSDFGLGDVGTPPGVRSGS